MPCGGGAEMVTPNWKEAPEWANYTARDEDGQWYCYETEPQMGKTLWLMDRANGRFELAGIAPAWHETLEKRP